MENVQFTALYLQYLRSMSFPEVQSYQLWQL